MPGLVPGIHAVFFVDGRAKPGHDDLAMVKRSRQAARCGRRDAGMVMFFIRAKRAATAEARRIAEGTSVATPQTRDRLDRSLVMELAAVILQLFSLSLVSGTCLLLFVSVLKFWTAK